MIYQDMPMRDRPHASAAELQKLMELPDAVRWVRLGDVAQDREIACIDGRHEDCTLGAPGGNTGELVLLASVLEWYAGEELSRGKLRCMLERYTQTFGRFYLHTDTEALSRLARALGEHPAFAGVDLSAAHAISELVREPPEALREALLTQLVLPEHIGCGHLSAMLTDPLAYRVRRELVEDVIRAFFQELWMGSPHTDFVVLDGHHQEQALLSFHTRRHLDADSLVPGLCPAAGAQRVFVSHLPALRFVRRRAVELFSSPALSQRLESVDHLDVSLEVERLAERHLALTLERLAPGLPRYRVEFDELELMVRP